MITQQAKQARPPHRRSSFQLERALAIEDKEVKEVLTTTVSKFDLMIVPQRDAARCCSTSRQDDSNERWRYRLFITETNYRIAIV